MSCLCFGAAHLRREPITISAIDVDVLSIHAILIFPFCDVLARCRATRNARNTAANSI